MSQSFLANGNLPPSRIVKQDAVTGLVDLCTAASDQSIGVLEAGTHLPNLNIGATTFDDGFAGVAVASPPAIGQPTSTDVEVFTVGDVCMVEAGSALNNGVQITSSSVGRAVAATDGQWTVGRTMMTAAALGDLIRCLIQPSYYHT